MQSPWHISLIPHDTCNPWSVLAATWASCIGMASVGQGWIRYLSFQNPNDAANRQTLVGICTCFPPSRHGTGLGTAVSATLIDGLGQVALLATLPVSRARTQPFQENRHFNFRVLVTLKLTMAFISRVVSCSARIVLDRQTHTPTHRPSIVTLAAHERRGLIRRIPSGGLWPI